MFFGSLLRETEPMEGIVPGRWGIVVEVVCRVEVTDGRDLDDSVDEEVGLEEKMYLSNKSELLSVVLSVVPSAELLILDFEVIIVLFPDANKRGF